MYVVVEHSTRQVWAIESTTDRFERKCLALDFLHDRASEAQYGASACKFAELFRRYATDGDQRLPASLFHMVDQNNGIYQFIRGDLRVFCFIYMGNAVLTHGAIKRSQKVDPQEVQRAVRMKGDFLRALPIQLPPAQKGRKR